MRPRRRGQLRRPRSARGCLGGAVGLFLSRSMIAVLPNLPVIGDAIAGFPNLGLSLDIALFGFAVAVVLCLAAGLLPAMTALRARNTANFWTV